MDRSVDEQRLVEGLRNLGVVQDEDLLEKRECKAGGSRD